MEVNQQFGNYTITEIIGRGGMGTVGKAVDVQGNHYAIKQILPEIMNHKDAIARFEREKHIQTVLKHPNLLPLIDAGSVDGLPYFVMPFVEGVSLSQRLQRGPLKYRQAHVVVRDIGSALAAAHEKNILHRDIKPGNIMLHPEGRAYLTDFGIASDPDPNPQLRTKTINISQMGTSDYMAPEVLRGQRATPKSEIYSFGVTIYEMIVGQRFSIALYQYQDPWSLLPTGLDQALERATHASVARRHISMQELTDECTHILESLSEPVRRRPMLSTIINPVVSESHFFTITHKSAPKPATVHPIAVIAATMLVVIFILVAMIGIANNIQRQSSSPAVTLTPSPSIRINAAATAIETRGVIFPPTTAPINLTVTAQQLLLNTQVAATRTQNALQTSAFIPTVTPLPTATQPILIPPTATQFQIPTPSPQSFGIGQSVYVDVTSGSRNTVYIQPSARFTNFEVPIQSGTLVYVVGTPVYEEFNNGGQWWWQIQLATGYIGYLEDGNLSATRLVAPTNTPNISTAQLAAWGSGNIVVPRNSEAIFTTGVNARMTGVASVTLTGEFQFDATRNDYVWYGNTFDGLRGAIYQSEWQSIGSASQPDLEPWAQGTRLTTISSANLYFNPLTTSSIIGIVSASETVIASGNFYFDEQSNQWWWYVNYGTTSGWIPQVNLRQP